MESVKSLFHFHRLKGKGFKCICLQCIRRKLNHRHSFGKPAVIHKRAIHLRVISIAYLIEQSLVNILSQIPEL